MTDNAPRVDERYRWVLNLELSRSPSEPPEPLRVSRVATTPADPDPALGRILAKVPLFRGCHKPQLKKLLRLCAPLSLAEGERACTVGEPSERLLILLSGELAVLTQDGIRVATVRPVTTVGEMGFVTNWPRTVTLVATMPCSMMAIRNAQLRALLQSAPDLHLRTLENIVAIMAARIVSLNEDMRAMLSKGRAEESEPL